MATPNFDSLVDESALEARWAQIDRVLDEPWTIPDDFDESELFDELLIIERMLGRAECWPHGRVTF